MTVEETAADSAESAAASPSRRIAFVANELYACAWYRCVVPGVALMKRGDDVLLHGDLEMLRQQPPDVFVNQRVLGSNVLQFIEALNASGALTVFDLDDEPWAVPADNPGAEYWTSEPSRELLTATMRAARVVTTTTPELAERFRRFNPNVHVLPNMLPADLWPAEGRPVRDASDLVIGWAGGMSHMQDLRLVEEVLHQVLDKYPDVTVRLVGAEPGWFARVHDRFEFVDPVSIEEYPAVLSTFDIAIAPLVDNRFNEGKSDLKPLEYAMVGLPVVVSKSPSYARSVRHGETGLVARNAKDWLQALRALVESASLRERLGTGARTWAETRTIDPHISRWEKVYGITR